VTPRGWQHTRLDSIASVERGRFSARPRNDTKYYGGDIPFLQTGDVSKSSGKITTFAQTLNELGLQVSKLFPRGTLLITIAANIGDVAEAEFDFACPDSLVAVRPNIGIDKDWLKYFLQGKKRHFESLATQNAQANINLQLIKPMEIELPPADEQRRIAAVLSTWDAAVAGMERIIEAKEKRKRALVQLLLFGKTRLGKCNTSCLNKYRWFSAPKEWNVVKIKSLAQEVIVRNSDGDGIPVLSCTKYRGLVDSLKYFDKQIFSKDTSAYKIIEYGQFAYATNHIEEGSSWLPRSVPQGVGQSHVHSLQNGPRAGQQWLFI
jgi:type I restriction enzyme S subunit